MANRAMANRRSREQSADKTDPPIETGERLRAVLGDKHIIFDPDADAGRIIKARLDGENHARLQNFVVAAHDVGVLMHVKAEPVAGLGAHEFGKWRCLQDVLYRIVELVRGDPRPRRVTAGAVGLPHRFIKRPGAIRTMLDEDRAGDVGQVTVMDRAEIQ